jgi:hypothetical protein
VNAGAGFAFVAAVRRSGTGVFDVAFDAGVEFVGALLAAPASEVAVELVAAARFCF